MGKTIGRREFLKKAGITAGVLALTGAGAAQSILIEPEIDFPEKQLIKEGKMSKILIAYASKCGSTGEIAVAIGDELNKGGFSVDVLPVQKVQSLEPYDSIVLGTALRFEKPLNEMMDFITKFGREIPSKKIACFSAGVYMREPSEENRAKTEKMLEPMMAVLPDPVGVALFGGKIDYKTIAPFWRFLVSMDSSGLMREGDSRDWAAISAWAVTIGGQFVAG